MMIMIMEIRWNCPAWVLFCCWPTGRGKYDDYVGEENVLTMYGECCSRHSLADWILGHDGDPSTLEFRGRRKL